jgi:hypothetical protein
MNYEGKLYGKCGHRLIPLKLTSVEVDKAIAIVKHLADWSRKYPRQQVHSFSAKVDEQLIEIENEAKALFP